MFKQPLQDTINRIFAGRRGALIALAVIAVLVFAAYSNTLHSSFHFDDNQTIVENTSLKSLTWQHFKDQFNGTRPVVNLSLLFNYTLGGQDVIGWHIFNIAFHIANSFFVYLFLLRTLTLPSLRTRYGAQAPRMALFGALLFALHPIQTESVTYIITRTELLAAFFYLAAFLFFIAAAESGKIRHKIGVFVMSLLAMGSKEWAVTLPAMLIAYDYVFLADGKLKTVFSRSGTYALAALPWMFVAYAMSAGSLSGAGFGISGQKGLTAWTYLLTSCNVMWTYIRLLILPIHQNLDYGYPIATSLFSFPTLLSAIGHIAVVSLGYWLYTKKKWTLIPFGIAWFYITLSPTQSFVPILDVIFEHRLYLPSLGFIIVFITGFEGILEQVDRRLSRRAEGRAAPAA